MEKLTDEHKPNETKPDLITIFLGSNQGETIASEPLKKGQENEDPNDTFTKAIAFTTEVTTKGPNETNSESSPKKGQEKPFKCPNCTKSYCEKQDLDDHVTHYHLTICEICRKQFEERNQLKLHMASVHFIKIFDCVKCHRGFMGNIALKKHLKDVHFHCENCDFFAMSKNGLALHVSKHVQCEGCKKLFNGSKKAEAIYLAHVKKCLGIDPKKKKQQTTSLVHHHYEEQISPKKIPSYVRTNIFECEKCPTVFKEKVEYKAHMKEAHFVCDECGRSCAHKQGLSKHMKAHKKCDKCGKYFSGSHGKKNYETHMKRCGINKNIKLYCSACDILFDRPSALERHRGFLKCKQMQELEKERDLQESIVAMDDAKKEEEFSIDILSDMITNLEEAQDLMFEDPLMERSSKMQKFVEAVLLTYKAEVKRKLEIENKDLAEAENVIIKSNSDIKTEMVSGSDDDEIESEKVQKKKGYVNSDGTKCDLCDKNFKRRADLNRHIRHTHDGERNHECDVCGKAFTKKFDLKRHIKNVHEAERVHECLFCDEDFVRRVHLKKHIKETHEGEQEVRKKVLKKVRQNKDSALEDGTFQCGECGHISASKQGLSKHKTGHKQCPNCKLYFNGKHALGKFKVHIKKCGKKKFKQKKRGRPRKLKIEVVSETEVDDDENYDEAESESTPEKVQMKTGYVNSKGTVCDLCSKPFNRRPDLNRHIKEHHEGHKKHACNLCDKGFTKKSYLDRHIRNAHDDNAEDFEEDEAESGSEKVQKKKGYDVNIYKKIYPKKSYRDREVSAVSLDMTVEAEEVVYKIDPNEMLKEYEAEDHQVIRRDPQPDVDNPIDDTITKPKNLINAKKRDIKEAFGSDDVIEEEDVANQTWENAWKKNAVKKKKPDDDGDKSESGKVQTKKGYVNSEGTVFCQEDLDEENVNESCEKESLSTISNIKVEIVESEQSVDMPIV